MSEKNLKRLQEMERRLKKPKSLKEKILRDEKRAKEGPKIKKEEGFRDSYQPKTKVTKPDSDKRRTFNEKLRVYETLTGESALQPLQDLIRGPSAPDIAVPDLASEVREGVEAKKALIRATPKMYPMYYERAKKGKFIKVKTKLGRTKKTKLL